MSSITFSIKENNKSIEAKDVLDYLSRGIEISFDAVITTNAIIDNSINFRGHISKTDIMLTYDSRQEIRECNQSLINRQTRNVQHYLIMACNMFSKQRLLFNIAESIGLIPKALTQTHDTIFAAFDFSKIFTYKEFGKYDVFCR